MEIKVAEISSIIKDQISNFDTKADVAEVGTVLSVGDGIVLTTVTVEYELIGAACPQAMSGSLDSLRFYDRELSQKEITQILNRSSKREFY